MDARDAALARTARAVLALAFASLLSALPWRSPPSVACPAPASAAILAERSVAMRCDGLPGRPLVGPARLLFGQGLDPNTADAATLAVLPGLGVGKAEAIVRERVRGAFTRAEDLQRVPGIGAATIARLRPWLVFAPLGVERPVDPAGHGK